MGYDVVPQDFWSPLSLTWLCDGCRRALCLFSWQEVGTVTVGVRARNLQMSDSRRTEGRQMLQVGQAQGWAGKSVQRTARSEGCGLGCRDGYGLGGG